MRFKKKAQGGNQGRQKHTTGERVAREIRAGPVVTAIIYGNIHGGDLDGQGGAVGGGGGRGARGGLPSILSLTLQRKDYPNSIFK